MTSTVQNSFEALRGCSAKHADAQQLRRPVDAQPLLGWSLVLLACLFPIFLLSGCSVLRQTHETVQNEHLYSSSNRRIEKRMEEWAEHAYLTHCGPDAMLLSDNHYKKGFHAGFARYLRTGSTTEPLLPPPEYLKAKYVSWDGRDAVNRWIRGHEVGAGVAAQSGYRELIKIPVLGAIAQDDIPMPPAESVIIDAVMGTHLPEYAPVHPQPIPPGLPTDEELAPFPEPTPSVEEAPSGTPSADRDFDAFSLPIRSTRSTELNTPTTQAESIDTLELDHSETQQWADTPPLHAEQRQPVRFAQEPLEAMPYESLPTLELEEELPGWANDAPELAEQSSGSHSAEELDFQWLENLAEDETALDEENAAWERSRAEVPPTLEHEYAPQTPTSDELWLHPPEVAPAEENGLGFPDSSTITVVFEEQAAPQPANVQSRPERQPAVQPDRASLRRTALYQQIANAAKPERDHVDPCVQPPTDHELIDETAWPDLDRIMSWPAENEPQQ
jgi:hypothetical protein